jgi:hypothetical protein
VSQAGDDDDGGACHYSQEHQTRNSEVPVRNKKQEIRIRSKN